ncbi:MAG TPA: alpha/beta hydrolase-fold protein [Solirubrobacteraceae bacterium]|nr:alpha/beta hydrolase-fold protein [Solirubrobacteraceae bacterium]
MGVAIYVHRYWLYRGFPPPVTPKGVARGTLRDVGFFSPALHQHRHYLVYLPPGYAAQAAAGRRFPVMYLLHAPPGRPDGFVQAGALAVDSDVLVHRHAIRPMIFVIPYGHSGNFGNDTEWANDAAGPYESFVLDVVRNVDRRFATLRGRRYRGIAGLSEGGYGALNIGLRHLRSFSVLESWSGYYAQTRTGPFAHATQAQLNAASPNWYLPRLIPQIHRLGLRVYLYQGVKDEIEPWRIRRFAHQLFEAGVYVRWGYFPGGHDWGLWRRQTPHMLRVASKWFSTPPLRDRLAHAPKGIGRPQHPRAGHPNPRSPRHRRRHRHAGVRA